MTCDTTATMTCDTTATDDTAATSDTATTCTTVRSSRSAGHRIGGVRESRAAAAARWARALAADERGDVPGWVLVTLVTSA